MEPKFIKFKKNNWPKKKQGECYTVALPFALKRILRQKKNLWKLKYFSMQKYN